MTDTAPDVPAAAGIHDHPTMKLGRRPPKNAATLNLADFVTAVPDHPVTDPAPAVDWPMDYNDKAGDCVVAGLDHTLQCVAAQLGVARANWSSDQILAYYQTQNPGFASWADAGGPNDGGMDIQTFLEHLVQQGEILAFGKVDHTNEEQLKAATYIGLAVVTGELLDVAQQNQDVWDYDPASRPWGGHCTCTVAYDGSPDRQGVVTWGKVVESTWAFVQNQVEEAWFVLTTDLVNHPGFRDHFDLAGFAAAVSELTGGKVVVPVDPPAPTPPSPDPGPTPAPPTPVDPLADFPAAAVDHFVRHPHSWRASKIAAAQIAAWEARHNIGVTAA